RAGDPDHRPGGRAPCARGCAGDSGAELRSLDRAAGVLAGYPAAGLPRGRAEGRGRRPAAQPRQVGDGGIEPLPRRGRAVGERYCFGAGLEAELAGAIALLSAEAGGGAIALAPASAGGAAEAVLAASVAAASAAFFWQAARPLAKAAARAM